MFYSGLKPTNVFMENDAVARRCHQILIQKTHSWVATPQLTTFIRLSSILNPFSFLPLVSLQMDSLLLAIMASWKLLSAILFQDGKQTYKVNLTHIPTCFISMPDSVIRWKKKKNQYLWMWPENKNVHMPKGVKLKSRSQCIWSTVQNWPPFWKELLYPKAKLHSELYL